MSPARKSDDGPTTAAMASIQDLFCAHRFISCLRSDLPLPALQELIFHVEAGGDPPAQKLNRISVGVDDVV